jgi:hypothetical protein
MKKLLSTHTIAAVVVIAALAPVAGAQIDPGNNVAVGGPQAHALQGPAIMNPVSMIRTLPR